MSAYDFIKKQIKYSTGVHSITCSCGKIATAKVTGAKKDRGRIYRDVDTHCRHCGTIYTFRWFRSG